MLIPNLFVIKPLVSVFIVGGKHMMLDPTAERGEADAAPHAQGQPVVRVKICVPSRHTHTKHTCTLHIPIFLCTYLYTDGHSASIRAPAASSWSPLWFNRMESH